MEWKKGNYNRALFILFTVYLAALTWIVLFKLAIPANIGTLARERVLNVIPFYDIIAGKYFDKFDMVANIIVFIPFGIYAGLMLNGLSRKYRVMPAFLLSLCYEAIQFIFAIGVADITDVMMNAFGAYLGIILFEYISEKLESEQKTRRFITVCSAASVVPMGAVLSIASVVHNVI